MYLRPSGHIYGRDFNTLSVALATGYRSARSASRLGSRRGMVPVRSARTPQFEERVYQWSRHHRKGSACGCGFRQGRRLGRWAPPNGSGWRSGFPCVPHLTATGDVRVPTWRSAFPGRCATFPGGVCAETWTTRLVWVIAAAALRAAVPAPTGRTGQRSAFPCLRATLSRWGRCREGHHTGTGRYAVRPPSGGRCRPEGRRSLPGAPPLPVGGTCRSRRHTRHRAIQRFRCASRRPDGRPEVRRSLACSDESVHRRCSRV